MTITQPQREEAFAKATPAQVQLYDTPEASRQLHEICVRHQLLNQKMTFYTVVGDVILGLLPPTQLPELLIENVHISQADALRVTGDLLDFLAPVLEASTPNRSTDQETVVPTTNQPVPEAMEPISNAPSPEPTTPPQPYIIDSLGNSIKDSSVAWGRQIHPEESVEPNPPEPLPESDPSSTQP